MIKMLAISMENTLLDKEDAIPTSTMFEIDKWKQSGAKLTIITNRSLQEALYYNNDYPFIDYIIALNGSIVYDVEKNKIILENNLSKKQIEWIEETYHNSKMIYYTKEKVWYEKPNENVVKIEIIISKKDKEKINNNGTLLIKDKQLFLEISNTNSMSSFEKIMQIENLKKNDILAFIGNESEKEWITKIPNTYVVSNAIKSLKSRTKNKTKSNQKKGVESVLKKIKN